MFIRWLETQICYLRVLEVRSPKGVSLGHNEGFNRAGFFLKVLRENPFTCLFHPLELPAFFGL